MLCYTIFGIFWELIQVWLEALRFHADQMQFVCEIHNFWSTTLRWFSWYLHQKGIQSDLLAKFSVWKLNEKQYYLVTLILKTVELCMCTLYRCKWLFSLEFSSISHHKFDPYVQIKCLIAFLVRRKFVLHLN